MAGAGSLDYAGVAKVAAGQNPVTGIMASLSGATVADGKVSFPFTLGGTLQAPKFSVKSGGAGGAVGGLSGLLGSSQQTGTEPSQTQQTPADLVKGVSGLFKKKQTTQQPQPK